VALTHPRNVCISVALYLNFSHCDVPTHTFDSTLIFQARSFPTDATCSCVGGAVSRILVPFPSPVEAFGNIPLTFLGTGHGAVLR